MTTATRRAHAPAWVLVFLAAFLAVVLGLLTAGPASAATTPTAQNAVGASNSTAQVPVGASAGVVADQRLGNDPPQPRIVMATGVAANTAADVARPLSQAEARTLTDALRPDKLSHVFDPKHNFGPLVETYGSEAGAMEQIVRSLDGAGLPSSGIFEVTTQVGGQSVVVRGAVVDGVARIGTAFTP